MAPRKDIKINPIFYNGMDISEAVVDYIVAGSISRATYEKILGPCPKVYVSLDNAWNFEQLEEVKKYCQKVDAIKAEAERIVKVIRKKLGQNQKGA